MGSSSAGGFGLEPEFATKVSQLLDTCRAAGHDFRISQGLRPPQTQAEYYCRWAKRKPEDIDAAASKLRKSGAPWLADLLGSFRDEARQANWLTSSLPGAGWHQWGLAADCYCYRNGVMVQNGGDACYKLFADEAKKLGLTPGYYFSHQDSGHVQSHAEATAASIYAWSYIDSEMKRRFEGKTEVALADSIATAISKAPLTTFLPAASLAAAGYFKDDPALAKLAKISPARQVDATGAGGMLRVLAETYNRVGGLFEALAEAAGIEPMAALAVWYVESGGRSFTAGHPVLRFENHKFFANWGKNNPAEFDQYFQFGGRNGIPGKASQNHKFRTDANMAWQKSHVDRQEVEYTAFHFAGSLSSKEIACLSSSFGGPQIMGFNAERCGYPSASAMADAFGQDERWQVLGFADFCRGEKLIKAIAAKDWNAFGQRYNGDGGVYGPKIKAAYDLKADLERLPRRP